jgi:hypothetical protein
VSILGGLVVVAVGVALGAAGLAAWTGSWNFWATPGVPGYGVLPLLLLPAGIMCLSAGIVALLGDFAENGLVALALLPLLVGFFGGAILTIPGFFLLIFWSPKRIPDRIRPRWLPQTWTPPENSFSTLSRPSIRGELRDRRPPGPHWPAVLVEVTASSAIPSARYGFLALKDDAITWYACTWDTPECKEAFSITAGPATELRVSESPPYSFLQAPIVLRLTAPTGEFNIDVFTGIAGRRSIKAKITSAIKR